MRVKSRTLNQTKHAEIAQLVEHATENRGVPSPILGLGTRSAGLTLCGRSTVVVRLLAKEKVVGSNPIARSNMKGCGLENVPSAILIVYIWRRGQVVRQGSAKSSSGVQIPSTPLQQQQAGSGLLLRLSTLMEKSPKKSIINYGRESHEP